MAIFCSFQTEQSAALYKIVIASVNKSEADNAPGSILQKNVRIKNTTLSGKINDVGNRADFHSTETLFAQREAIILPASFCFACSALCCSQLARTHDLYGNNFLSFLLLWVSNRSCPFCTSRMKEKQRTAPTHTHPSMVDCGEIMTSNWARCPTAPRQTEWLDRPAAEESDQ